MIFSNDLKHGERKFKNGFKEFLLVERFSPYNDGYKRHCYNQLRLKMGFPLKRAL